MTDITPHQPHKKKFIFSVSQLLVNFRRQAQLTQDELAALCQQLAIRGEVTRPLTQQAISRIESNADADPHMPTLETLSIALSHAMMELGYENATPENLFKQFKNAKRQQVPSRDVSEQAAALDAELSTYPQWYQDMIWQLARTAHFEISTSMETARRNTSKNKSDS
jgi:transcriptional regulator with XRE-family HTH domain